MVRDQAAESHDRELETHDAVVGDCVEVVVRAEDRRSAAAERAVVAGGRARAAVDREQAAGDRVQAQADRDVLLDQLAAARSDGLTGAVACDGPGDFDHAIDRAHGALARLVIACVDVAWDPNAPSCPQACK